MFLLLGPSYDRCCDGLHRALSAAGHPARIVENPLAEPFRLAWRLEAGRNDSRLVLADGGEVSPIELRGVFIHAPLWLDPGGWDAADHAYMQTEQQAALLGWLWSLACPVVSRYPSGIWFRPRAPLLDWHGALRRAGLPAPETLVTNVAGEARAFAPQGCVYTPLTSTTGYLVSEPAEWEGLAEVQRRTPTPLTRPHGAPVRAFVVGAEVVWDGAPPAGPALDGALRRFSRELGVAFLEVDFAPTAGAVRVVSVEPFPVIEGAGPAAEDAVVAALVRLLTRPSRAERRLVCTPEPPRVP